MHLSTNRKYQAAKINSGFEVVEFDELSEFKSIVIFDHAPAEFKDGVRKGENVLTADCIEFDIDNIDTEISIMDCREIFKGYEYFIATSRNHQKEKITGGKPSPAKDRYHIIFPLPRPVTKTEYEMTGKAMIEKYPFFDRACVDASRFFFGNRDTQVFHEPGQALEIVGCLDSFIPPPVEFEYDYSTYAGEDKRSIIFSALQIAANRGIFTEYLDWIKLGMALKSDGWTIDDWRMLSNPGQNMHEMQYKWDTFDNIKSTGGTLLHFARQGDPNCLKKGSMAGIPRGPVGMPALMKPITKASTSGDSSGLEPSASIMLTKPSKIDHKPSMEIIRAILKEIFYDDDEGKKKLQSNWYFIVPMHDMELANCIHYDYTIGTIVMEYHNTTLLDNAILQRLQWYVPINAINDQIIDRLKAFIMQRNSRRNRVAEAIDMAVQRHLVDSEKEYGWELDEFLSTMKYSAPSDAPFTTEQIKSYYKEVWHLFFLRMHMHIDGTRIQDSGGYKFLIANDIVPVLQGAQNIGKTTLAKYIAMSHIGPDLYVDLGSGSKERFGGQDTAKKCRGKMIAEIGEMKIMKSGDDVETVKSFISKETYEIDVKYVEHTQPLPVTVSFIGTSNDLEYLNDSTGNRRWWPIWLEWIDKDKIKEHPELIEKLHAHYARRVSEMNTEQWFKNVQPSENLLKFIEYARDKSMVRYSDYEAILEVISKKYEESSRSADARIRFHNVAGYQIEKWVRDSGYDMRISKNSIATAMEHLGYKRDVVSVGGVSCRGFKKILTRDPY